MEEKKGWLMVIGVLTIMLLIAFGLIWVVYDTLQRTVQPVQSMTGELATQVSSVLNPTPTILPSPITIVRDVRSLSRLETIQFTIEKVITAEKNQGTLSALFGDKLILVGHGNVIAGFDLSKVGANDVKVKDGVLYITLPEPEIFTSALDNDKSYIYDRETGLLTKGDIHLESSARSTAEHEIEQAAIEDGILEQARQNGENYLSRLLSDLGYPEVIFVYPDKAPTATAIPSLEP
jgi:hypothetical protein